MLLFPKACPNGRSNKVYPVTSLLIEKAEQASARTWKDHTWNCGACWHQWSASEEDERLDPSG